MNKVMSTLDGSKVYISALLLAINGMIMVYNALFNGEGDATAGFQMIFEAAAIAGFRSTANKVISNKE